MTISVQVQIDGETRNFIRRVERKFGAAELRKQLEPFLRKQAIKAAATIVRTQLSGQALGNRTGTLARSIEGRLESGRGRMPGMRVGVFRGPALRYAGVQEFGTRGRNPASPFDTIRPKRAKALAMPINDSVTATGAAKFSGPREDPRDLVFIPFRGNQIVIGALFDKDRLRRAQAASREFSLRDVQAAYLLLTKVDLRPRNYLTLGMDQYLPVFVEQLADFLEAFLLSKR